MSSAAIGRRPARRLRPGCGPATWPAWPASGCGPASCAPALSALGIAIGVAAIVAVLGLAASSQAALLAEIQPAGHQPADRHQRADLRRQHRRAAGGRARHDRPAARRHRRPGHRHGQRRQRLPARSSPRSRPTGSAWTPPASACPPWPAPRRPGPATSTPPPPASRSPCSAPPPPSCWASTGSGPGADLAAVGGQWFYVDRHPQPRRARPADRHLGPGRLPRRASSTWASTGTPPRSTSAPSTPRPPPPGSTTCSPPRPTRRTRTRSTSPSRRHALTAQADAQGRVRHPVPRPRRGRAAGRRGRRGQHHDHLRARAPLRRSGCAARSARPRARSAPSSWPRPSCSPWPAAPSGSSPAPPPPPSTPTPRAGPSSSRPKRGPAASAAALLIGALAGLLPAIRAARLSPTQALWTL